MTMQVGMMASDGIVLASDTRRSTISQSRDTAVRHSFSASKITIDPTCRMAVTCATDMIAAAGVGEGIISDLPYLARVGWESRQRRILELGINLAGCHHVQCIVALVDPAPEIYFLQCASSAKVSFCNKISDWVPAGDTANTALFWTERYYAKLPTSQLMRLAAHQVVASARSNSAMIGGLELVFSDDTGFHRVAEADCLQVEADAKKRSRDIGELILLG